MTACGATPHVGPAESEPLCRFEGVLPYGVLLDASGTHSVAQGYRLPVQMTLAPGPTLEVLARAEGYELRGRGAPELHVVAPTRLGRMLYVGARRGVGVVAVDRGRVRIGPLHFVLDDITFVAPPEAEVRCEDLALPSLADDDEERDREAFDLRAVGERMLPADQAVPLRAETRGEVAATVAPARHVRFVAILEEREGAVRVAYHHWTGAFVVGWVDDALALPAPSEPRASGFISGRRSAGFAEDFTVCRPPASLSLSTQVISVLGDYGGLIPLPVPGPIEPLGTVRAGTPLIRVSEGAEGRVAVRPLPTSVFTVPPGVSWWVRGSELGDCAPEHYEPPRGSVSWRDLGTGRR